MASHSSTLAWKIPWMEEPGGLQSMGSRRVRHDWAPSLSLFTFMRWRRKWHQLQYSCLENPMDRGAWQAAVHGVSKSWDTIEWLTLEKAMAPHFSTLAWKILWMEEPGGLQSMGSLRVRHDWVTSRSLFTFMHWRRKWQPTPVFLPRESQGQGSMVGCRLWGCTEPDTTEVT